MRDLPARGAPLLAPGPADPAEETRRTPQDAWWGRVFGHEPGTGSDTVVVTAARTNTDAQAVAATLGVPDTAFVVDGSARSVRLRTFSPFGEVEQCFQTSLAVLSALDAPIGEPWTVSHVAGETLEVVREPRVTWATVDLAARPRLEPAELPDALSVPGEAVILRQARSRLHVRLESSRAVEAADVAPAEVLRLCEQHGVAGLVLAAPVCDGTVRMRVFTSSLGGAEDLATGGAAVGVGLLAGLEGTQGDVLALQGAGDGGHLGHLWLRVHGRRELQLGGVVDPLMRGALLA